VLKLVWRIVVEHLMDAKGIVKGFDVLEHRAPGFIEISIVCEFDLFMLQSPKKTFQPLPCHNSNPYDSLSR
jgi:hypothetical protein